MTSADRLIASIIPRPTSPPTSIEGSALWVMLGLTLGFVATALMVGIVYMAILA